VRSLWDGFRSVLGTEIGRYIAQKRALGRRFRNEERSLRLLDRFLEERVVKSAQDIDGELLEVFLASRPRTRPRSYNHLLAVIRGFFDWLSIQGVPNPGVRRHAVSRFSSMRDKPAVYSRSPGACPIETGRRCAVRVTAPSSPCSTVLVYVSERSRGFA
jgi:hypothetical protein